MLERSYFEMLLATFILSLQGMSPSDHEDENDPDGPFAFKRRKHCHYFTVSIFACSVDTMWALYTPDLTQTQDISAQICLLEV